MNGPSTIKSAISSNSAPQTKRLSLRTDQSGLHKAGMDKQCSSETVRKPVTAAQLLVCNHIQVLSKKSSEHAVTKPT